MSQPVFEFFNNKFGFDAEKCQKFVFLVKGRFSCLCIGYQIFESPKTIGLNFEWH